MKGLDDGQAKQAGLPDWRVADPMKEPDNSYSSFYFDKPGNIPIVNSLPNFSKFVITPVFVGGIAIEEAPGTNDKPAESSRPAESFKPAATSNPSPVPVTGLKKGSSFTAQNISYHVVSVSAGKKTGTVKAGKVSANSKLKKITIPDTVSKDGCTFKVEKIAKICLFCVFGIKSCKNILSCSWVVMLQYQIMYSL